MEEMIIDQSAYDDSAEGFRPKTAFVKSLLAARKQAVLDGLKLLTIDEILKQKEKNMQDNGTEIKQERVVAEIFIGKMHELAEVTRLLVETSAKLEKICLPRDLAFPAVNSMEFTDTEWPEMFHTFRESYNIIMTNVQAVQHIIDSVQI
jgi:hypothetical protein